MRILAVAQNTFREAVRDKVLYVLLFFAAAAIFGSKALGWVSVGQDVKIIKDISLASVSVFGVLISIFVGTNLIYKELDKRTLYTILASPVKRHEFILGKYLGLAVLLALTSVLMTGVAAGYVALVGGTVTASFFWAALLSYWQLLLLTAFAVMLSTMTSPILGAMIVFFLFLFGHATNILIELPPQLKGTSTETILQGLYYVIPNLSNFNIRAEAANGQDVAVTYVVWALAYGVGYSVVFLTLSIAAFEDKDV